MGTNFQYTGLRVGLVATSRVLTITTGAAQLLTLLTSGAILVNVQNNGPANMTLGDSAIIANSGDVVFPYASREFYPVVDTFSVYVRATSAVTAIAITEYFPA